MKAKKSNSDSLNWFKLNPGKIWSEVSLLDDPDQRGAYLAIIIRSLELAGLPAEPTDLAFEVKLPVAQINQLAWLIERRFTTLADGRILPRICQELIQERAEFLARQKFNGNKGGRPRKTETQENPGITQNNPLVILGNPLEPTETQGQPAHVMYCISNHDNSIHDPETRSNPTKPTGFSEKTTAEKNNRFTNPFDSFDGDESESFGNTEKSEKPAQDSLQVRLDGMSDAVRQCCQYPEPDTLTPFQFNEIRVAVAQIKAQYKTTTPEQILTIRQEILGEKMIKPAWLANSLGSYLQALRKINKLPTPAQTKNKTEYPDCSKCNKQGFYHTPQTRTGNLPPVACSCRAGQAHHAWLSGHRVTILADQPNSH